MSISSTDFEDEFEQFRARAYSGGSIPFPKPNIHRDPAPAPTVPANKPGGGGEKTAGGGDPAGPAGDSVHNARKGKCRSSPCPADWDTSDEEDRNRLVASS